MSDSLLMDMPAASLHLGLFGKHPVKGDFIEAGLSVTLRSGLEQWLDATLSACRQNLGPAFEPLWDIAPPKRICFWIGETLAGEVVAGLLQPSRDKAGRRYPLLVLISGPPGASPLPPVLASPLAWTATLATHFDAILSQDGFTSATALLDGLALPVLADRQDGEDANLLAMRQDGDIDLLCKDAAAADHRRGAAARSYWWTHDLENAVLFSCPGLPDWRAFAWLLGNGGKETSS